VVTFIATVCAAFAFGLIIVGAVFLLSAIVRNHLDARE
jgi:hypothetical protein